MQAESLNCNLIFERILRWTWPNVTAGQITEVGQIIRFEYLDLASTVINYPG